MRRSGQSQVEYSLLVATVALLVLSGVFACGPGLRNWLSYLVFRITSGV